jgi:hypothetical protein
MKPPRPFESVVTELVKGLRSGEIVLAREARAAVEAAPWRTKIEEFHKRDDIKHEALWNLAIAKKSRLESHIFPHLWYARKREVLRADLEKNVERAKNRIWFLVGGWPDYSMTRNILSDVLLVSKVTRPGKPVASPAQHEIRIIVTEVKDWDKWKELFDSYGLAGNVRMANSYLDGWLAFADQNLFVDVPKMDENKTQFDLFGMTDEDVYRNCPRGMFVVEERSDPDEFRHLEHFFDELWNASSPYASIQ